MKHWKEATDEKDGEPCARGQKHRNYKFQPRDTRGTTAAPSHRDTMLPDPSLEPDAAPPNARHGASPPTPTYHAPTRLPLPRGRVKGWQGKGHYALAARPAQNTTPTRLDPALPPEAAPYVISLDSRRFGS